MQRYRQYLKPRIRDLQFLSRADAVVVKRLNQELTAVLNFASGLAHARSLISAIRDSEWISRRHRSKLACQTNILPLTANRQGKLIIRNDDFHGMAAFIDQTRLTSAG